MALALPRQIQLKLEHTLAQWTQWRCTPVLSRAPEIVEILTPGISNFSVLVESGQQFVVRIDGLNPATNGLNRQTEWRTLETAHRAGLAPCPRYFNPELGSLVCDFLATDETRAPDVAEVGRLLRAIHRLPARHHRLDLAERILRYEKQLKHQERALGDELQDCSSKASALLHELGRHHAATVLCHNDLLRTNRIFHAGKLWALDWEYCGMGSPWYDIAVVIQGDALGMADTENLLKAYLGRAPDAGERATLYRYGCIYRYLELLWYLARDEPVLTETAIEEKSLALANMLARGGD
jgi:thiamine kinase